MQTKALIVIGKVGDKVYQRCTPGAGNISNGGKYDMLERAYVIPVDPRTPAQIARRQLFAEAMSQWAAMSQEQRKPWIDQAKQRGIAGINAFLSHQLRSD